VSLPSMCNLTCILLDTSGWLYPKALLECCCSVALLRRMRTNTGCIFHLEGIKFLIWQQF
jgi:hypothetical protein